MIINHRPPLEVKRFSLSDVSSPLTSLCLQYGSTGLATVMPCKGSCNSKVKIFKFVPVAGTKYLNWAMKFYFSPFERLKSNMRIPAGLLICFKIHLVAKNSSIGDSNVSFFESQGQKA